ncbi:MAG: hypothetical protein NVSMB63_10760 [Sediminibacterium sp.]
MCLACNNGSNKNDSVDSAKDANNQKTTGSTMPDTATAPNSVIGVDQKSADFAIAAANGGMMEVELGKWAQDHAIDGKVKGFGAMMVTDHSRINNELKSIAASKNISLPAVVGAGDKKQMDDLMAKKMTDFDKAYVKMMIDDHKKDIDEFEKASKELTDSTLKHFAADKLAVLKKHYLAIRAIKNKIN